MIFRPYTLADREACLAIFDANTPRFFAPHERPDFAAFLDAPPCFYGVLTTESGELVGCGGIGPGRDTRVAVLAWGMLHPDHHGAGLGRRLLLARLARLIDLPDVTGVRMDTSHETVGFFERLGFRVTHFTPNGYREGLHRYDLELRVDEALRQRLPALVAAAGLEEL